MKASLSQQAVNTSIMSIGIRLGKSLGAAAARHVDCHLMRELNVLPRYRDTEDALDLLAKKILRDEYEAEVIPRMYEASHETDAYSKKTIAGTITSESVSDRKSREAAREGLLSEIAMYKHYARQKDETILKKKIHVVKARKELWRTCPKVPKQFQYGGVPEVCMPLRRSV